jgi:hypothetical protein
LFRNVVRHPIERLGVVPSDTVKHRRVTGRREAAVLADDELSSVRFDDAVTVLAGVNLTVDRDACAFHTCRSSGTD